MIKAYLWLSWLIWGMGTVLGFTAFFKSPDVSPFVTIGVYAEVAIFFAAMKPLMSAQRLVGTTSEDASHVGVAPLHSALASYVLSIAFSMLGWQIYLPRR
jgi:hypothetical protein